MANYCTLFPDHVKVQIKKYRIEYDISFFCLIHDIFYEEGFVSRKQADLQLYISLLASYPEYDYLWLAVYKAVRKVGWIFWYWHRVKDVGREMVGY